jgi:hypothetical protein
MPLRETGIKAMKPRDKRYTGPDQKGLVLKIFPTGRMLWHFRYALPVGRYDHRGLRREVLQGRGR